MIGLSKANYDRCIYILYRIKDTWSTCSATECSYGRERDTLILTSTHNKNISSLFTTLSSNMNRVIMDNKSRTTLPWNLYYICFHYSWTTIMDPNITICCDKTALTMSCSAGRLIRSSRRRSQPRPQPSARATSRRTRPRKVIGCSSLKRRRGELGCNKNLDLWLQLICTKFKLKHTI